MRLRPFRQIPTARWLIRPATNRVADRPREAVRQWLLHELAQRYHYPPAWLAERVRLVDETTGANGVPAGFFGFVLATNVGDPYLSFSIEPGAAAKAEQRTRELLRMSASVRLGVSTDGTIEGTRVLRQRSQSDACDFVLDFETFALPHASSAAGTYRAPSTGNGKPGRALKPLSAALEGVFFEAHSHIRDIDGLHADESLDELCKILHAKLFDEETTHAGAAYALQRGLTGTVEECAAVVRRVYQEASRPDVHAAARNGAANGRPGGVFNAPIRLSSPALVKVVETLERYSLGRSRVDVKGRAFQRVVGPAMRAAMGQYFTPLEVIELIVAIIEPRAAETVLDPFAGSGHFLTRALDAVRTASKKDNQKPVERFALENLHGIEKSDRMVRVAMIDLRLHGDGHSHLRCNDALLDFRNYPDLRPESFDVVMTNPPFGSLLGPEATGRLGAFSLATKRRTVPLEVLGLERCVQFLRPGGRLAIVLPDGVLANRATDHVREWLVGHVKVRAVLSLPVETFSPFGANIKTSVLFARKWKLGERWTDDDKVYLGRIDNIGYDASGRPQAGSETGAAAAAVKAFLQAESW